MQQPGRQSGAAKVNDSEGLTPEHRGRRFLTLEQVAEELNIGLPTVRALLSTGQLRGMQVGGRGLWRVGLADLEQYLIDAYAEAAERIARGKLSDEEANSP